MPSLTIYSVPNFLGRTGQTARLALENHKNEVIINKSPTAVMRTRPVKLKLPANVRPVKDRHGKIRYRFRHKGWPSAYLSGEPGTPEFADIIERGPTTATPIETRHRFAPRSLDDLFRRHKASPRWKKKAISTQLVQSRVLQRFFDRIDRMHETPSAANNLHKFFAPMMMKPSG